LLAASSSSSISVALLLVGMSSVTLPSISSLSRGSAAGSKPLPPHLQAQPALVHRVCVRCVKQLAKEEDPLPSKICADVIDGNINCPVCKAAKSTCVKVRIPHSPAVRSPN